MEPSCEGFRCSVNLPGVLSQETKNCDLMYDSEVWGIVQSAVCPVCLVDLQSDDVQVFLIVDEGRLEHCWSDKLASADCVHRGNGDGIVFVKGSVRMLRWTTMSRTFDTKGNHTPSCMFARNGSPFSASSSK